MPLFKGVDGYYDDKGNWIRTKFCFAKCYRCTCLPPDGQWYNPIYDKSKIEENDEHKSTE